MNKKIRDIERKYRQGDRLKRRNTLSWSLRNSMARSCIVPSVEAVKKMLSGRQTRYRIPAACYLSTRNVQQNVVPDFDKGIARIVPDTFIAEEDLIIPNPFSIDSLVPVREQYFVCNKEGSKYCVYIADGMYRKYGTKEELRRFRPDMPVEKIGRYDPDYGHFSDIQDAMLMSKNLIRLFLDVHETGVEYFSDQSHFEEEGYDSQEAQLSDWERRYRFRPDFAAVNDPVCYYCNFSIVIN